MCVAISRIVNCAFAAVSVSRIISLSLIFNSQDFLALFSLVVETRGPLHTISCLIVLYAFIIFCFTVIVICLVRMTLLSCYLNTFSFNGVRIYKTEVCPKKKSSIDFRKRKRLG